MEPCRPRKICALKLYGILQRDFRHAQVDKVRVEETMLNSFEYAGGREIRY